jgi:hypothetical protein
MLDKPSARAPSRATIRHRERLERYCQRFPRPDYREGPLDSMLWALVVMVALAGAALLKWGGR